MDKNSKISIAGHRGLVEHRTPGRGSLDNVGIIPWNSLRARPFRQDAGPTSTN